MFKRIDHVEVVPSSLEMAIDFYTNVLGFKVKQRQNVDAPPLKEIVYIELNGTVVEFLSIDNPSPPSRDPWQIGYKTIALEVEDMDKAVEYLKGKGVGISRGPISLGTSKRAEIRDPDGLAIELRQW